MGGAATGGVAGIPPEVDLDEVVEEVLHAGGEDDAGLKRHLLAEDPAITPT